MELNACAENYFSRIDLTCNDVCVCVCVCVCTVHVCVCALCVCAVCVTNMVYRLFT